MKSNKLWMFLNRHIFKEPRIKSYKNLLNKLPNSKIKPGYNQTNVGLKVISSV